MVMLRLALLQMKRFVLNTLANQLKMLKHNDKNVLLVLHKNVT